MIQHPNVFPLLIAGLLLLAPFCPGDEIHEAARSGDLAKVAALIEKTPGLIGAKDAAGRTPLHWACRGVHFEVVKLLAARGADVNARDNAGMTALHSVSSRGHLEAARVLLDKGARVEAEAPGRWTALHLAARNGRMDVAVLLAEKGAPLDVQNDSEDSSLHAAAWADHWDIVDFLIGRIPAGRAAVLNLTDFDGNTLLHLACRAGRIETVRRLIAAGADLQIRNTLGRTAHNLADEGGYRDIAGLLAQKGADRGTARFPKWTGPYMGQKAPGTTPELFAKGIVSTRNGMYGTITFSPAGDEAFWKPEGPNMLFMKSTGGLWSAPQVFLNPDGDSANVPFFSIDGQRLYFMRGKRGPSGMEKEEAIWYIEKTRDGWSEPRPFDPVVNSAPMHWQFSMDHAGSVYLGSDNIFCAGFVNGKYLAPKRLPAPVNELYTEKDKYRAGDIDPFISPAGDYLIYARFQLGALLISFKQKDGSWSEPRNLSEKLQTEGNDKAAKVTPDGKYLFFQSVRRGSGASRGLYWVDARIIDELRPKD